MDNVHVLIAPYFAPAQFILQYKILSAPVTVRYLCGVLALTDKEFFCNEISVLKTAGNRYGVCTKALIDIYHPLSTVSDRF